MVSPTSTGLLLLSNALTAILALVLRWPIETLLWPYWIQSVIIGWYSARRMLSLRQFSTEGLTVNDRPVPETVGAQRGMVAFFALHYGFFHAGYLGFLVGRTGDLSHWDWIAFAVMAVSFVTSHGTSFRQNLEADARGRPNLGTLMFLPYARIVPMHLMILFGTATMANEGWHAVLLFSVLKTGADVVMHHVEHRVLQRQPSVTVQP